MTGPARREDLLALTPDTLAALANRGLVKRAAKDLEAGAGPQIELGEDGSVLGTYPDGSRTRLPSGVGLDTAECSCAATGVCRHRIGLVLAYQELHTAAEPAESAAEPVIAWSPGAFDDEQLEAALGRVALTAARRAVDRGYTATVHRGGEDQPVPWVELASCTVRFPVPHELGYALTDAATPRRGETIALAVWAFRAADTTAEGGAAHVQVSVGGRAPAAPVTDQTLDQAVALADELLLDGVAHTTPVFAAQLDRAGAALSRAALHWPAAALTELRDQVDSYAARDTRYAAAHVAELVAELHARRRAGALDRPGVLGTREPAETPLRRVRLVALGCRISGRATTERTAEVYFAQPDAGIALVLRKRWEPTEDQRLTGADLATRRLLGSPLRALAGANVVSETISRSAGRTVTIGRGRVAATSITPVGSAWADLPGSLLVRDTAAHLRAWDDRPPRLIRPRVAADTARVLAVASVDSLGYDPARQRLEAVVRDPSGTTVLIHAEHDPACPGRLDALAETLGGGQVRFVSGLLRPEGGRPVLDPLAVLTADGLVVPDLAAGAGTLPLAPAARRPSDPIGHALESGVAALAELVHTGLRASTRSTRDQLASAAADLRRIGLTTGAAVVQTLATTLATDTVTAAIGPWADAAIHLLTALELHQERDTAEESLR